MLGMRLPRDDLPVYLQAYSVYPALSWNVLIAEHLKRLGHRPSYHDWADSTPETLSRRPVYIDNVPAMFASTLGKYSRQYKRVLLDKENGSIVSVTMCQDV
jgi:hypothetical protein